MHVLHFSVDFWRLSLLHLAQHTSSFRLLDRWSAHRSIIKNSIHLESDFDHRWFWFSLGDALCELGRRAAWLLRERFWVVRAVACWLQLSLEWQWLPGCHLLHLRTGSCRLIATSEFRNTPTHCTNRPKYMTCRYDSGPLFWIGLDWTSLVQLPTKHVIGRTGDGFFYGSNDATNSVKALKEDRS